MTNGIKIVTSAYELSYEEGRGGAVYKSFPLTTHTIREIIYPQYQYVIYTDKNTYEKYKMYFDSDLSKPNVQIKFQELNDEFYTKNINPIRQQKYNSGEIWERVYCIKNYLEVIFNKIKHLRDECSDDYNTVWIDAGLFGTSCHDGWRDWIYDLTKASDILIKKVDEKINKDGFICMRGTNIQINPDLRDKIRNTYNVEISTVSAGLFGGKSFIIKELFNDYENILKAYINDHNDVVSEQEIISVLTHKSNNVKFYDFDDWLDLQKALLKIMDLYDETKYIREKNYV
jgi:hypothetical protein